MSQTSFGYLTPENVPLFTDLYELRMMQAYLNQNHNPRATFSLFFRELPENRGYMVAAGLEQAVHYVRNLSFSDRSIEFLAEQGFDDAFLSHLESFEFTGEMRALPEGTPVFANEPMLEVTAPILQAQLLETALINQIGFQTLIATKASRMRDVIDRRGDDQRLVDFGSRRSHGTDAGIKAARAAYVGGFAGTSNTAAGELFGVPVFGTMAHSWVQSFASERDSFETFVAEHGEDSILLIDTYDTVGGAQIAEEVAEETDTDIRGVRLDSGDLPALSREVDEVAPDLDKYISSGIDEYAIREFFDRDGARDEYGLAEGRGGLQARRRRAGRGDAPDDEALEGEGDLSGGQERPADTARRGERPRHRRSPGRVSPGRRTAPDRDGERHADGGSPRTRRDPRDCTGTATAAPRAAPADRGSGTLPG
jgi:nicotinate phosphoribosyltransferase